MSRSLPVMLDEVSKWPPAVSVTFINTPGRRFSITVLWLHLFWVKMGFVGGMQRWDVGKAFECRECNEQLSEKVR